MIIQYDQMRLWTQFQTKIKDTSILRPKVPYASIKCEKYYDCFMRLKLWFWNVAKWLNTVNWN